MTRAFDCRRSAACGHEMKMYRWSEFAALCRRHGELVDRATANFLTVSADPTPFDTMTDDEWAQFVSFELRLCREPGVVDGGTHLLAAVRVTEGSRS